MKKVLIAALALSASTLAQAEGRTINELYAKTCTACHSVGAAGAPKTHDEAAWAPRMDKGMDALVASVTNGLNAMPPKGMCFDCTPEEYKGLIEFMAKAPH